MIMLTETLSGLRKETIYLVTQKEAYLLASIWEPFPLPEISRNEYP